MQRGASMTTDKHVDPAIAPQVIEEANASIREEDIPEGAVRFELTAEEIEAAISEASTEVRLSLCPCACPSVLWSSTQPGSCKRNGVILRRSLCLMAGHRPAGRGS